MRRDMEMPTGTVDSLGMSFVRIPADSFLMGAEKPEDGVANGMENAVPRHRVNISKAFYMAQHEVTQAQWEAVMGNNPSHHKGSNYPVENVSYVDAQVFIQRLNQREGTFKFRLPTEAEWEYAARAGTETAWFCGDRPEFLRRYAWVDDDVDWADCLPPDTPISMEEFLDMDGARRSTHPVGRKQPNSWGLYDMHGNVGEWVADWYDPTYYARSPKTDPQGPKSGEYRVARGGCSGATSLCARSAYRNNGLPTRQSPDVGFRVALTETASGALTNKLERFLPNIFKSDKTKLPVKVGVPQPTLPKKRFLSWPLRVCAGFLCVMFVFTVGWMALEGERGWYGGVLPAVLFGRYVQKGTVGDKFFKYVWRAFLAVAAIDVAWHEWLR